MPTTHPRLLAMLWIVVFGIGTGAQRALADTPVNSAMIEQLAHDKAEAEAIQVASAVSGRLELEISRVDPRNHLAPCQAAEAFVPPNVRLWGRSRVGVRCTEGARWTVYVPLEVRVYAQVAVAARSISIGQTIAPEDVRISEVELTREAPGLSTDGQELIGRQATRMLLPGSPLRAEYGKSRVVIQSGDPVKVVFVGNGFTVEGDGRAVNGAADGDSVRVQVDSGHVISGTARDGRRVEMR